MLGIPHSVKRQIGTHLLHTLIPPPPTAHLSPRRAQDCSKRKIRCRVGCGLDIEAGALRHHEEEICTQPCCWEGCGERLGPLVRREVHERSLCPERPAECPLGCGVRCVYLSPSVCCMYVRTLKLYYVK